MYWEESKYKIVENQGIARNDAISVASSMMAKLPAWQTEAST